MLRSSLIHESIPLSNYTTTWAFLLQILMLFVLLIVKAIGTYYLFLYHHAANYSVFFLILTNLCRLSGLIVDVFGDLAVVASSAA